MKSCLFSVYNSSGTSFHNLNIHVLISDTSQMSYQHVPPISLCRSNMEMYSFVFDVYRAWILRTKTWDQTPLFILGMKYVMLLNLFMPQMFHLYNRVVRSFGGIVLGWIINYLDGEYKSVGNITSVFTCEMFKLVHLYNYSLTTTSNFVLFKTMNLS